MIEHRVAGFVVAIFFTIMVILMALMIGPARGQSFGLLHADRGVCPADRPNKRVITQNVASVMPTCAPGLICGAERCTWGGAMICSPPIVPLDVEICLTDEELARAK